MKLLLTKQAWRKAIRSEVKSATVDPSYLMKLYSENPKLLKVALAAYQNVPVEALGHLNVTESSILISPLKRALCAFADGLAQEREGLT